MKISLTTVKDVFKAVRSISFQKENEEFDLLGVVENMDDDMLNDVCRAISKKHDINYADDLVEALEVISDFLLSIIDNYQKSVKFKMVIERFLSPKIKTLFSKIQSNLPN